MSTWKIAFSSAIVAVALAAVVRADDFTKLTLLTFSGPVDVPGVTLPAGTYRFSLADPETGRRVVKIADKDGTRTFGMFLSIPNERLRPSDKPVVMFKETAAGAPPAVQAWFYPGERYGYEFAYPHEQALKIAKATHQSVLSYNGHSSASTTDEGRIASMKSAEVGRIDENDRPVSNDEALKQSSEPRTPATPSATASSPAATSRAEGASDRASTRTSTPVATTGSASATAMTTAPQRRHLPRTGSELPLLALVASLSLVGGFLIRLARHAL